MGKDQNEKFHPEKGKPSGVDKQEGLGIQSTYREKPEQYIDITDKYIADDETQVEGVQIRHPNRNTSKGGEQFKGKENKSGSDKTIKVKTAESETNTAAIVEEIPGKLTRELFTELASYRADGCLSLYFPTNQSGVGINEGADQMIFKNQLQDAGRSFKQKNLTDEQISSFLKPGYDLIEQDEFWKDLRAGLAVFIAEGFFKYIKLPVAPVTKCICENSFYVTPLVPIISTNEYYYLLVISKQQAKLFRADAFGMEYVPLELPQGIDEVKRLSDKDASTFRTGSRAGTGGANFHGMGGGNPDEKTNIATYFEAVDDILFKEVFNKENAPLLLAGVEYLIPIYRSVCDYHNVYEHSLTGNQEYEETSSLYAKSMQIMQPYFDERNKKALNSYGNQSATNLTSSDPKEIIPASYYGRISHLFVEQGVHIWGQFDEMVNEIKFHNSPEEGGDDLVDNAVVKTLMTGGDVFLLSPEEMPANAHVAAIFRY